jgi:hypothetical protein
MVTVCCCAGGRLGERLRMNATPWSAVSVPARRGYPGATGRPRPAVRSCGERAAAAVGLVGAGHAADGRLRVRLGYADAVRDDADLDRALGENATDEKKAKKS